MTLEEYFDRDKILERLIKYRVGIAHAKHKDHLITGITSNKVMIQKFHKMPEDGFIKEISEMMPPRRKWAKLDLKARKKDTDSLKRNIRSLRITIKQHVAKGEKFEWLDKLNAYIDNLIAKIVSGDYKITKAEVRPYLKDKKKGKITYRPIAVYNLSDRIVISLTARYLTDAFDWTFKESNCAYAFRSVLKQKAITHQEAIQKMKYFIEERKCESIYIAESDIRKFFDCVNHDIAKECLNKHIKQTQLKAGIEIDKIAEDIFDQYLSSYFFKRDVYEKNGNSDWFKEKKCAPGEFKWEEKALKTNFYPEGIPEKIGVPQGGAISCLISNLVLDKVDKMLLESEEFKNDKNLLYIRYCDDMIIMHTDYEKCKAALKIYEHGLTQCKLLYHEYLGDINSFKYSYTLYGAKFKPIYKLALKNSGSVPCVPWVAFVGYQLRYDGLIRVRRSSITKEKVKQKTERLRIMKSFGLIKKPHESIKNMKKPIDNIAYRLEQRFISMSVGRIKLHEINPADEKNKKSQGLCWTNGFKQLKQNYISKNQLKELDKSRRANLIKLLRHLTYLNAGKKIHIPKKEEEEKKNKPTDLSIRIGHPFSYHYYLHNRK